MPRAGFGTCSLVISGQRSRIPTRLTVLPSPGATSSTDALQVCVPWRVLDYGQFEKLGSHAGDPEIAEFLSPTIRSEPGLESANNLESEMALFNECMQSCAHRA